ncbi:MAG TPA: glycoside hydrolase family 15 protein, partial [Candidatus Tyrphobacter sp.]|nr:glycoside hydrolase family 15 protein [Candidatus Tyrphobacter sp.]
EFRWLDDPSWEIGLNYAEDTFESVLSAKNISLGIELISRDIVYNEKNIFLREVEIRNLSAQKRKIKIFFHQAFEIYESHRGDTAYFDPNGNVIIHYKGRRVFLIGGRLGKESFKEYSIGLFGAEGREGTYKDAEDGMLSMNAIEHGQVDSVLAFSLELKPRESQTVHYWIAAGRSVAEAQTLNRYLLEKTPAHILETTRNFWKAWSTKQGTDISGLEAKIARLFWISLFIIRAHVDNHGAILASTDYDMLQYGRDTYSYMWPRDGAFAAMALDEIGDTHIVERFFNFCDQVIEAEGYFMHKYRPDGSLGSSWHPWIRNGKPELPIQEDETAIVLFSLWRHYEISKDLEFIESVYNPLIKKSADFLVNYLNPKTDLPHPSYNLWEEEYGVSTYTSSAIYGALIAASKFAELLGKTNDGRLYQKKADLLQKAILGKLYNEEDGLFLKSEDDRAVDCSSLYGLFQFGVLAAADERLAKFVSLVEQKLFIKTPIGGLARYEGDKYRQSEANRNLPGNPWLITTLWLAKFYISKAKTGEELNRGLELLRWAAERAEPSGVLAEQIDPLTGESLSAAPLTWSHAEFVLTALLYLEKLKEFETKS